MATRRDCPSRLGGTELGHGKAAIEFVTGFYTRIITKLGLAIDSRAVVVGRSFDGHVEPYMKSSGVTCSRKLRNFSISSSSSSSGIVTPAASRTSSSA